MERLALGAFGATVAILAAWQAVAFILAAFGRVAATLNGVG